MADRWHLLKNLRQNLERWLETKPACLKAAADEHKQDESEQEKSGSTDVEQQQKKQQLTTTEQPPEAKKKLSKTEKLKLARQAKRLKRYETVKEMHEQGFSKAEIARCTNLDPKTIRRYINADSCPRYNQGTRASKLDPYKKYIRKRFQEDGIKATQILDEIETLGYCGGRTIMMDWVRKTLRTPRSLLSKSSPEKVAPEKVIPWTARRTSWLFVKEEGELSCDDLQALEQMKQADEKVTQVYSLGQRFVSMIKERQSSSLLPWLEDAAKSGIDALKGFAKGIKQDIDAVTNALRLPWSQGQVEGQVNRLKLIKRQMYGRANFDLLRKKVLFSNDVLIEVPP